MTFRNTIRVLTLVVLLSAGTGRAVAQPDIPGPPPPPVRIVAVPNGYQVFLNKSSADFLADVLANADEKQIAGMIRDEAKKRKEIEPDTAAKLELIAFVVNGQLPTFKKDLKEKCGPNGVCVTVVGLQRPEVKFENPRLNRAAGIVRAVRPLLPPEMQGSLEAMRAMARTTPLSWKIEPLE
jgi:hypothetical protein